MYCALTASCRAISSIELSRPVASSSNQQRARAIVFSSVASTCVVAAPIEAYLALVVPGAIAPPVGSITFWNCSAS